jgi:hypothetical protein
MDSIDLPSRLSYSQINVFNQCKFKFYLQYIKKYETRGNSLGLVRGTVLHNAYDAYLFNGKDPSAAEESLVNSFEMYADEGMDGAFLNQVMDESRIVLDAFLPWAKLNDNFEAVIPFEGQEQCETSGEILLTLPDGDAKRLFFKIDAIVKIGNSYMLLENKFRKNLDANGLEHDLQIAIYQAAYNVMMPEHLQLQGTIYNIVGAKPRKADNTIAIRKYVYRGNQDNAITLKNIAATAYEMKRAVNDDHAVFPMAPSTDCSWSCQFVGPCLAIRSGAKLSQFLQSKELTVRKFSEEPVLLSQKIVI